MLSKVKSIALSGLDGVPVEVETDINNGLPSYELVGLPDAAVKESRERVRSALKNSGKKFPAQKITVNLAPADLKKEGSCFDLAIAVGILKATSQLAAQTDGILFLGELALDGALRPVTGILPLLISAKSHGFSTFVIPAGQRPRGGVHRGRADVCGAVPLAGHRPPFGRRASRAAGSGAVPLCGGRGGEVRPRLCQGPEGRQARAGSRRCGRTQPAAGGAAGRGQDHARALYPRHHARHDL